MMQGKDLLVDIGNSRIKWGLLPSDSTRFSGQTSAVNWTLENLTDILETHWGTIDESIQRITVANVAGDEVQKQVTAWCNNQWQLAPQFVSTTAEFGTVKNGYQDYHELGVDRWLAVVAANHLFPQQALVIIDCGTAITIDTVLPDGQHRAGPIIAGRKMAIDALTHNTAFANKLQGVENPSTEVFVSNTKNAVLSGANFATAKALDAIIEQIRQKLSENRLEQPIKLIATGGALSEIMPLTSVTNYDCEPDLVMQGLWLVSAGES